MDAKIICESALPDERVKTSGSMPSQLQAHIRWKIICVTGPAGIEPTIRNKEKDFLCHVFIWGSAPFLWLWSLIFKNKSYLENLKKSDMSITAHRLLISSFAGFSFVSWKIGFKGSSD